MKNTDEILEFINAAGSDSLQVFGGRYEGGYCIQQDPVELASLIEYLLLIGRHFDNYIEIGSAAGGATRVLAEIFEFKNVFIIDNNQHPRHRLRKENLKNIGHEEFIGDSHSVEAFRWIMDLHESFDLAFIDGDHGYEGVKQDMRRVIPFMTDGYVIFHDIDCSPGVKKLTAELKAKSVDCLSHVMDFRGSKGLGIGLYKCHWK